MERREETEAQRLKPYRTLRDVCIGIVLGSSAFILGAYLRPSRADIQPVYQHSERAIPFCQPFKPTKQSEAEAEGLKAQGFTIVLAQELPKAFKERSEGKVELIEQTNRLCFTHFNPLGDSGKAVNEWWGRRVK